MKRGTWQEPEWQLAGEAMERAKLTERAEPIAPDDDLRLDSGAGELEPGPNGAPDARARERIARRFANLLDEALAAPEEMPEPLRALLEEGGAPAGVCADRAPDGSTGEIGHDLYGVWSAVTSVTQEVKLQARFFKELSDQLQGADLSSLRRLLEEQRGTLVELQRSEDRRREAARRAAQQQLVMLLVDLRDRLQRGAVAAAEHRARARDSLRPSWLARWFRRDRAVAEALLRAADELDKGYRLTIERLDDALAELDVQPIDCAGKPFDPRLMAAVDLEETAEVEAGTVLQVYQNGYLQAEELLRPAQVKVARRPAEAGALS